VGGVARVPDHVVRGYPSRAVDVDFEADGSDDVFRAIQGAREVQLKRTVAEVPDGFNVIN
jgi:hypothetical protein